MTGIYKITNKINGKCYIGKSECKIEGRWYNHKRNLKNDNHRCSNGQRDKLQNAWNKYGEHNFTFEVIEECLPEECNEREIYWIAYYDAKNNGYNNTDGGEGIVGMTPWNKGKTNIYSEETKQKISNSKKGQHHTEVAKLKISKAFKGEKHPMYGQHHTSEAKEKMSESHLNKTPGNYIQRTSEMYQDIKNNIKCKDFCSKYNVSIPTFYTIRKELEAIK